MLSSLFSRSLTPAWSFSCKGTLWRILLSQGGDRIIGECRDSERKETTFFCLDDRSGALLWSLSPSEERWWIGLEAVSGNRVFLHGFESPDMPEHRRIIALDLETGAEVWRNDEVTFWFAYQSRVYAYRSLAEKRVGEVLDLETGRILETHDSVEEFDALRRLARQEDPHEFLEFPETKSLEEIPVEVRTAADRETRQRKRVGEFEAVIRDDFVFLSYHSVEAESAPEDPRLMNQLFVVERKSGRKIFSDILQRSAHAAVPDAFFLRGRSLYCLKDRQSLVMIQIPENV